MPILSVRGPHRCQWVRLLLDILNAALAQQQLLPARTASELAAPLRVEIVERDPEAPPVLPRWRPPPDHSSEAARDTRTPRGQPRKNQHLLVTREHPWVLDPAILPADAGRHGATAILVQDLVLQPEGIRFGRAVWFVPSTGQISTAPLPDGYDGACGPQLQVRALPDRCGPAPVRQPPGDLQLNAMYQQRADQPRADRLADR